MNLPQIGVSYIDSIPEEIFLEFRDNIFDQNLDLRIEPRSDGDTHAVVEWLLPTAVVVYFAKSYFDGFLKEMGKDHYQLLKKRMNLLRRKLLGDSGHKITLISTQGKLSENNPFSHVLSIYAEADGKQRFKLLIQKGTSESEYEEAIDAFLSFLEAYHGMTLNSNMREKIARTRMVGGTLLLAFNYNNKEIEPIDPSHNRSKTI